jgi:hypothetical protein
MHKQENLEQGLKKIVSAFKRLRQTKYWKMLVCDGAWVIEVTGETGRWHIHIHALIIGKFVVHNALVAEWKKLTNAFVVHVIAIGAGAAISYITKYITKGSINPALADYVGTSLAGYRLFQTFGKWHNMKLAKVKRKCACERCGKQDFHPIFALKWEQFEFQELVRSNEIRCRNERIQSCLCDGAND